MQGVPLLIRRDHGVIARLAPLTPDRCIAQLAWRTTAHDLLWQRSRRLWWLWRLQAFCYGLQYSLLAHEDLIEALGQILQDMKAVGNLEGVGRAQPSALSITAATIPTDDLNTRVLAQPTGKGLGGTIWQEVDGLVSLQVHQDGAIAGAAPERKVIDPKHPWGGRAGHRGTPDEAQEGIRTGPHAQGREQARPGFAPDRQADHFQNLRQADRLVCVGRHQPRKPLGENNPLAGGVRAEKPPHPHVQPQRDPMPGQIGNLAGIAGMDARGGLMAEWTAGIWGGGHHLSRNRLLIGTQSEQMEASGVGENRCLGHRAPPEQVDRKEA
jgi:hypothetical protein